MATERNYELVGEVNSIIQLVNLLAVTKLYLDRKDNAVLLKKYNDAFMLLNQYHLEMLFLAKLMIEEDQSHTSIRLSQEDAQMKNAIRTIGLMILNGVYQDKKEDYIDTTIVNKAPVGRINRIAI